MMEAGRDGLRRAYPKVTGLRRDSSIKSLIVCARTVQAIGDGNACFTTETQRRSPRTNLAECAHACGAGRRPTLPPSVHRKHQHATLTTLLQGQNEPSGVLVSVRVHVCVIQDDKKNNLFCSHKYLFTFLLNKISHWIKNYDFNKKYSTNKN